MKGVRWLLLASTILAAACSSSSTAPIPLSALTGQWTPNNPEVPGLSYQFTLALVDTHVTGSGQWSLSGGQSGTVTITGSTTDNAVSLDLTLGHDSPGTLPFLIEHFDGRLKSASALAGTLTFSGGGGQQTYLKTGS